MLKRVDEIKEPLIVNKYYLVPCVYTVLNSPLPIILSKHDDTEFFEVRQPHYHYDIRFFTNAEINGFGLYKSQSQKIASISSKVVVAKEDDCAIVWQRRKCKRQFMDWIAD